MIICKVGALILLTSALCVIVVERQWIICYFIVKRLIDCGALLLDLLVFHRSYQDWLQIFFFVGGIGWGSTRLTFGI